MPLCFGAVGVGAGEHEDPVGEVAGRRPDLLAVDDPLVAVEHGPAAEVAEVGAGVGLGVALAPEVLAGSGCGAGSALLLVGPPLEHRVADHLDAEHVVAGAGRARRPWSNSSARITCSSALRPPPPYSVGQPSASRPLLVERRAPLDGERSASLAFGSAPMPFQSAGQVLGEERLDLLAVGLGLGAVGRLHAREVTRRSFRSDGPRKGHEGRPRRRRRAGRRRRGQPGSDRAAAGRYSSRARGDRSRPGRRRRTARRNPSATEPATTARRRSSSAATDVSARPDQNARRARSSPARGLGRAAGDRGDRRSRGLGFEATPCPTDTRRPSGSTTMWPMWPALPASPSSRRPSSTMPPPTPVDTTIPR